MQMNKLLNLPFPLKALLGSCRKNIVRAGNFPSEIKRATKHTFMPEVDNDGRSKNYILMRTLMDIGMGIIYIGVSLFIIFAKRFGFTGAFFDPPFNYLFAGICIAYGSFRIYRGVKKNYFRS